ASAISTAASLLLSVMATAASASIAAMATAVSPAAATASSEGGEAITTSGETPSMQSDRLCGCRRIRRGRRLNGRRETFHLAGETGVNRVDDAIQRIFDLRQTRQHRRGLRHREADAGCDQVQTRLDGAK